MTDQERRRYLPVCERLETRLAAQGGISDQVHIFEKREIDAVNAALASGRPLLVRGEPGTGKSQLARAVAEELQRAFICHVVDGQTQSRDLLWELDAVARLGEAQLAAAMKEGPDVARRRLAIENFVRPGPLWWAFDWNSAEQRCREADPPQPLPSDPERRRATNGCVVLIDEIDKSEPSEVANGLLEALGSGQFRAPGLMTPVAVAGVRPLIVISSNDERALPGAFLRRCLVLRLALPADDESLIARLLDRGQAHFRDLDPSVVLAAAKLLVRDRKATGSAGARPGQAEFLDLLRAVQDLYPDDPTEQAKALDDLTEYTLKKYVDA